MGIQRIMLDGLVRFIDREPDLAVSDAPLRASHLTPVTAADPPDVTLFDIDQPGSVDAVFERVSAAAATSRTIVLTAAPTPAVCVRAFQAGAAGLLPKSDSPALLLRAIRKVHAGEVWFGRAATAALLDSARAAVAIGQGPQTPGRRPGNVRRD